MKTLKLFTIALLALYTVNAQAQTPPPTPTSTCTAKKVSCPNGLVHVNVCNKVINTIVKMKERPTSCQNLNCTVQGQKAFAKLAQCLTDLQASPSTYGTQPVGEIITAAQDYCYSCCTADICSKKAVLSTACNTICCAVGSGPCLEGKCCSNCCASAS